MTGNMPWDGLSKHTKKTETARFSSYGLLQLTLNLTMKKKLYNMNEVFK
jgi:hypothetical protein